MAKGIYIDARELSKGAKAFERLIKEFPDKVSKELNGNALEIVAIAKRNAPADRGFLVGTISADNAKPLQKRVSVSAPYAAYIEFGTGKYAAQQVAKYPPNFQTFAAQFKGGGGGGFKEMIIAIAQWIRRKGINGTYSVKTRRRTGNRANNAASDLQLAYVIARSILINGIHPHPFLIPAVINQQKKIRDDMQNLIKQLKIV